MTFTSAQVENTSTDPIQMNFLLEEAKNEYQGHGSDSKVTLAETPG